MERLWQPAVDAMQATQIGQLCSRLGFEDYDGLYDWSVNNPADFWQVVWDDVDVVHSAAADSILLNPTSMRESEWFVGARLNYAENLLRKCDDHCALIDVDECADTITLTYAELYDAVACMAAFLRQCGVVVGDRVAAVTSNNRQAVITSLACSSLGAIWASCSPDFGIDGILDRLRQIEPKVLLANTSYHYNGKQHLLTDKIEAVCAQLRSLSAVIDINNRLDSELAVSFDEIIQHSPAPALEFAQLPFDHPHCILFSSGTTGVPKCIVHGVGGTLLQHLKEHKYHVDLSENDVMLYYTTCGWMMWNWQLSALALGTTLILYDGAPMYPQTTFLFDLIDQHQVTVFGTSARYIDALEKAGVKPVQTHQLTELRCILSTGSPLLNHNFDFVYQQVKPDLQLASISGGTDIISCFALSSPITPVWRGELSVRGLGMAVEVFDDAGNAVIEQKGYLVCTQPFPSMPVGFYHDQDGEKYRRAYFEQFDNVWSHGDFVKLTAHGSMVFYGRADATLNPGGVRIGTAEIYRQLAKFGELKESLVVGQPWHGDERIVLFVVMDDVLTHQLIDAIKAEIRQQLSPRHVPAEIIRVPGLPVTHSGKTMELVVKRLLQGLPIENQAAIANPEVLAYFRDVAEADQLGSQG